MATRQSFKQSAVERRRRTFSEEFNPAVSDLQSETLWPGICNPPLDQASRLVLISARVSLAKSSRTQHPLLLPTSIPFSFSKASRLCSWWSFCSCFVLSRIVAPPNSLSRFFLRRARVVRHTQKLQSFHPSQWLSGA